MATILNIDTSTDVCSVALTCEGEVLEHREEYEGQNHAKVLSAFIKDMLDYATPRGIKLDAVAVTTGPGSYTGLRIGLSEAKGLCFGLNIPLIGISTLELLTVTVLFKEFWDDNVLFVPMIDARRKEVFTGVYDNAFNKIMQPQPLILEEDSFAQFNDKQLVFMGNGSDKAADIIKHPNARFIKRIRPEAVLMMALSERAFRNNDFIDIAYSTPEYLKEFQATTPKKNV
jgi:tRNA threonylcarbamoyladenosine biosynthesis protein TsaB